MMNAKELLEIGQEMQNEFPARAAKIIEAAKLLEEFECRSGVVVCAYCGKELDRSDKMAIFNHVTTCEKRPENALLKRAFEVEDELYKWLDHLYGYSDSDCDICKEIGKALERYNSVKEAE